MRRTGNLRQVGLARALSKLGYCSRSQAAELVRAGRVKLNGAVRRNPEEPVILERDRIEVDGKRVEDGNESLFDVEQTTRRGDHRGR
jgi:23S rRNA pseudouridine2605 synthase